MGKPRWGENLGFVGPLVAPAAGVAFEVGTGFTITEGGGAAAGGIIGGTLIEEGAAVGGSALFVPLAGAAAVLVAGFAVWYVYQASRGGWETVIAPPYDLIGAGFVLQGTCNPSPVNEVAPFTTGWKGPFNVGASTCYTHQSGTNTITNPNLIVVPNTQCIHFARGYFYIATPSGTKWDTLVRYQRVLAVQPTIRSFARTRPAVDTNPALRESVVTLTQTRTAWPGPEERIRPWERTATTVVVETKVDPATDTGTDTKVTTPDEPYEMKPPRGSTREKKVFINAPRALRMLIDAVTETQDFVDCAVRNIHKWRRVGRYWTNKPLPPYRAGGLGAKAQYVYENIDKLDVPGFLGCLVVNEAIDRGIGRLSQAATREYLRAARATGHRPSHGPQMGPALGGGLGGVPRPPSF